MREVKVNQEKNYYVTSGDIRDMDVIYDDFFAAVDAAIMQLVNLEDIDINKLNVSLTRAYVESANSKPIFKLVHFTGANINKLKKSNEKLPENKKSYDLIRYNGRIYFAKFIQSVIINLET